MKKMMKTWALIGATVFGLNTQAASLDFTGGYRFEWNEVDNTNLAASKGRKSYLTNYFYLAPKFIAADGVEVITRFDTVTDGSAYENTYIGGIWGASSHFGVANPQGTILSGNKGDIELKATQLYLKINQEYGQILLGRVPFQFGLGMTYSSGEQAFDHFYHNRDMAAFKFVIGDTSIMPLVTRVDDMDLSQGQSAGSTGILVQYENKDSRSVAAIFKEDQKGAAATNNFPDFGRTISSRRGWDLGRTSFYFGRGWDLLSFKLEGSFIDGGTGLIDQSTGAEIDWKAYGLALELDFPNQGSNLSYNFKMGVASGDDPTTEDYEGFLFDRNYNVGMLMFNHRLGQYDIFRTSAMKVSSLNNSQSIDDETLSNAFYLAPKVSYAYSDKLTWNNTLVFAQILNNAQNSLATSKDLGLEWDTELVYKYNSNVTWINQFGILLPGKAWKNGPSTSYENATTYGFASKAAISF